MWERGSSEKTTAIYNYAFLGSFIQSDVLVELSFWISWVWLLLIFTLWAPVIKCSTLVKRLHLQSWVVAGMTQLFVVDNCSDGTDVTLHISHDCYGTPSWTLNTPSAVTVDLNLWSLQINKTFYNSVTYWNAFIALASALHVSWPTAWCIEPFFKHSTNLGLYIRIEKRKPSCPFQATFFKLYWGPKREDVRSKLIVLAYVYNATY